MEQIPEISLATHYDRIFQRIQKLVADKLRLPIEIQLWGGHVYRLGKGDPAVKILVQDRQGLAALLKLDEVKICEAYMAGSLDVAGDMLGFASLRGLLSDRHPLHSLWQQIAPYFVGRVRTDRQAIAGHYDFSNEFYFKFMDPTRCYSQAVFEGDNESLETAQRRKLDFAIDACRLKPGDHVLDVGGGWGSFTEHAGRRGIQVTSLTISQQSMIYLTDLIAKQQLPCRVLNQNFWEHSSPAPYDAIVILGVMEHLPDYPAVLRHLQELVKPGGRIYLDASAFREKYSKSTFVSRYIFPSDHAYFCLHAFLAEVAKSPWEVLEVYNDRRNYYLTCKAWAENLEAARDEIINRWGDMLYRRFRLYLWGSAEAFRSRRMDAYRVVLENTESVRTS